MKRPTISAALKKLDGAIRTGDLKAIDGAITQLASQLGLKPVFGDEPPVLPIEKPES